MHTIPAAQDYCIGDDIINCPVYDKAYAELLQTPQFRQLQLDAEELFANMSRFTGINVALPKDAIRVRAELKVHRRNDKSYALLLSNLNLTQIKRLVFSFI